MLLNFGPPAMTTQAIASMISASGAKPDHIVVIDNGSKAKDALALKAEMSSYPEVELLALPENLGFGGGMNLGAAYVFSAGYQGVILLNNDVIFSDHWYSALTAGWNGESIRSPVIRDLTSGAWWWTGGTLSRRTGRARHATAPPAAESVSEVCFASGCALLFSSVTWNKIGGYFEPYFMYWEDVDLCHRARLEGIRLESCNRSIIDHVGGGSTGTDSMPSALMHYYASRNRWIFLSRAQPGAVSIGLNFLLIPIRVANLALRARRHRIRPLPHLLQYLKGTGSGLMYFVRHRAAPK